MVAGLCNQLFFPVNEFPAPCNHPNFLGEFVQADGWARLAVTPLNLVQVSCGELFYVPESTREFPVRVQDSAREIKKTCNS